MLKARQRRPKRTRASCDGGRAPFDYGFGWFIDRVNGHRRVMHDGGTPGFSSIMQQYPEDGLTVIVLTNHADTILETLASEIAECSPLGLISTRATMRAGLADRVLAATNHELAEQTKLRATEDFKEGVKATAERRVANFKGR